MPLQTLKSMVHFSGVNPGQSVTLPHGLSNNFRPVVPDVCTPDNGNFVFVAADEFTITFQNTGTIAADCDVLCESWHTIERAFGATQSVSLVPAPFIPAGGGGGAGQQVIKTISAGTAFATSQEVVFSNSNGISFGADGTSVITAAFDAIKTIVGHGGSTASGPTISFQDGNGVTFGISGNTITASVQTAGGTATGVGISAGTQTAGTGVVVFSNSNGISFGMNASTVTATAADIKAISVGGSAVTNGTVVFSNSNSVSFGYNGSTITASVYQPSVSRLVGFTAAGGETQLTVTFTPAAPASSYSVLPFLNGVSFQVAFDCPASARSVSQFVAIPSGSLAAGDQIGFHLIAT
jgi:hypothetical protein